MEANQRAIVESVFSYIIDDDIDSLNLIVSTTGDVESWRHVFRFELNIEEVIQVGEALQYDIVAPKLMVWGSPTISSHHLAALRGVDDLLRLSVRQLGIGVDVRLSSGVTALHVAAFGGQLDTVKMLIDELHANVNATDEYGWTALHYAAIEGQFAMAELLISRSIDVMARDRDGATAAFRAHTAGYEDIVCLIGSLLDDSDDLLNIAEDNYAEYSLPNGGTDADGKHQEPLYAVVDKNRKDTVNTGNGNNKEPPTTVLAQDPSTSDIRRIIGEQLADILEGNSTVDESPYQVPIQHSASACAAFPNIGYNTLTRVIREELMRFKERSPKTTVHEAGLVYSEGQQVEQVEQRHDNSNAVYEEIGKYSLVDGAGLQDHHRTSSADSLIGQEPSYPPPPVPSATRSRPLGAPPLPQRGDRLTLAVESPALFQTLQRIEKSAAAMEVCFATLADKGLKSTGDWKRLGRALPLCKEDKVEKRLKVLEQRYSGDERQLVLATLREWRKFRGEQAHHEALLKALRQCGLDSDAAMLELTVEQSSA